MIRARQELARCRSSARRRPTRRAPRDVRTTVPDRAEAEGHSLGPTLVFDDGDVGDRSAPAHRSEGQAPARHRRSGCATSGGGGVTHRATEPRQDSDPDAGDVGRRRRLLALLSTFGYRSRLQGRLAGWHGSGRRWCRRGVGATAAIAVRSGVQSVSAVGVRLRVHRLSRCRLVDRRPLLRLRRCSGLGSGGGTTDPREGTSAATTSSGATSVGLRPSTAASAPSTSMGSCTGGAGGAGHRRTRDGPLRGSGHVVRHWWEIRWLLRRHPVPRFLRRCGEFVHPSIKCVWVGLLCRQGIRRLVQRLVRCRIVVKEPRQRRRVLGGGSRWFEQIATGRPGRWFRVAGHLRSPIRTERATAPRE